MPVQPSVRHRPPTRRPAAATALLALLVPCLLPACSTPGPLSYPARRYEGLDSAGRAITTRSPEAQEWFDQGLALYYGFNHDEAVRSFHQATVVDPGCTMAWWGLAAASGIDLNNQEMSEDDGRRAHHAAQQALATAAGSATPVEAALARAIATRYAWPMPEERTALDEAYAAAMEEVYQRFPDDPDVATLYAEALMLLQPWDYWTAEGEPKGRLVEFRAALEQALALQPDHPGACHFYVHAMEAGEPQAAEAAADLLAAKVPGSGHLLHMPSHIYVHLGRYPDASDANERAVAADQAYFALADDPGFYLLYYGHNLHMLAFAAMMEGREQVALEAARQLVADIPASFVEEQTSFVDGLMATPLHVLIRFGHWEQILEEPRPAAYQLLSRAEWHYARGVALSALGRTDEARLEQQAFEEWAAKVPEEWMAGANGAQEVLGLARQMLAGELLWREGRVDEAFEAMAEGTRLEDALVYDEPPGWMQPVRHAYGALLMAAERPAQAEEVYREDLRRNPGNGWSLLGLEQALRAQGRDGDADEVEALLAVAWSRSDVRATSSCFCEPGPLADA